MRPTTNAWKRTIRQSHTRLAEVTAYYEGQITAELPVIDGSITYDAFAPASRRCTVVVPQRWNGTDYRPGTDVLAPLAANGQWLAIRAGVRHPDGSEELVTQGTYVITDWELDNTNGTIVVTGSDLWTLLERAPVMGNKTSMRVPKGLADRLNGVVLWLLYPRLVPDPQPGWLPTESRILEFTTTLDPGGFILAPDAFQLKEGDSRTGPLLEVATMWPATLRVNDNGLLEALPPLAPPPPGATPDVYFTDVNGTNAVLVTRGQKADRDKIYNCVVLSSRSSSTGATLGSAAVQYTAGPFRCQGPYGYHPLIQEVRLGRDQANLDAAALARLERSSIYAMTETLEVVPDPSVELDDVAEVQVAGTETFVGRIVGITLPLGPTGPMTVTLSNSDAQAASASIRRMEA